VTPERRCPTCGALVSAEAEWCGQCYAALPTSDPAPKERPGGGGRSEPGLVPAASVSEAARGLEIREGRPAWTCPVCEAKNPIEAAVCSTCGTPFARLFADQEERPDVDPQSAAVRSMVLPGLGHWKLGLRAGAVARMIMFGWAFGALLVLLVSRFGKGGLGPTMPLFVLFLGSSAAIYAVSAIDAYRIASGELPLVSSRTLLWASAGLVVLSVLIASFVTLPAARR